VTSRWRSNRGRRSPLVGPSGAGKSTVFPAWLQRFYDIASGRLRVDGVDVRETRARGAAAATSRLVPQEATIFFGSVLDNVRYAGPMPRPRKRGWPRRLHASRSFVLRLPQGYDTEVGERGLRLSGGQRQRLASRRAHPEKTRPLLLLDEATSALDAESERAVQSALETAMRGRTTIVIAHRLATVQRVDRIFVLDHGRIVDAGHTRTVRARRTLRPPRGAAVRRVNARHAGRTARQPPSDGRTQ